VRPDGCCDKHDDSAACVQAGWRRIKLEEESFYNVKYQQFECLVAAVAAFVATPYPICEALSMQYPPVALGHSQQHACCCEDAHVRRQTVQRHY
jgi:hypothetical protein